MKTTITLIITALCSLGLVATAQDNVAINATGNLPHQSAMLDVSSSDKGVLFPRMSDTEMNNIGSPATGLVVFNTTQSCIAYFDGSDWKYVYGTAPVASVKKAFVVNSGSSGNFGGLNGADAACQSAATNASLTGTYKALLTDGTTAVLDRWGASPSNYNNGIELPSGTAVASDWTQLTTSALSNAINKQADGSNATQYVLTGMSTALGTAGSANCSDWTSTSGNGTLGNSSSTNSITWWRGYGNNPCTPGVTVGFYCFEQ
jgi:hypothetical protein